MIIIRGKKRRFHEKLEPATKEQFDLLQKQIDSDPETARMLASPMNEIPQYFWLYYDETDYAGEHCLFDILKFLAFSKRVKVTVLFSKAGKVFTGFLMYKENGREISAMKMASFIDDKRKANSVLAADLVGFVEKEISKRTKIEWKTAKQNSANGQYEKLLNGKKFIWSRADSKTGRMWVYTVTGRR